MKILYLQISTLLILFQIFGTSSLNAESEWKTYINTSQVNEIIVDGETGFLIPPGDAAFFSEKLKVLIGDPLLRRSMGKKAKKRVIYEYSKEKMFADFDRLFGDGV